MANKDTRSKRASSVGILLPFMLACPLADGTLDQADRQHKAHRYSGIAAAVAGATSFAGAVVHPAQLRGTWPARLRDSWPAQTGSTVAARTRRPVPAQTKEAD